MNQASSTTAVKIAQMLLYKTLLRSLPCRFGEFLGRTRSVSPTKLRGSAPSANENLCDECASGDNKGKVTSVGTVGSITQIRRVVMEGWKIHG